MTTTQTCSKCKENIASGQLNINMSLHKLSPQYNHMACVDFDDVMPDQSLIAFQSWHIRKLIGENRELREKVITTFDEVLKLMENSGEDPHNIREITNKFNGHSRRGT